MRLERIHVLAVCALLSVFALHSQDSADDEISFGTRPYIPQTAAGIRVQANLVEVRVVVRDASGEPVAGLKQSVFQVFDNGKPQIISAFSVETSPPRALAAGSAAPFAIDDPAPVNVKAPPTRRNVALFFDDLNMQLGDLVPARTAAQGFISESLEPGDHVGIFTSSSTVTLEPTGDARKLLNSLAQLRPHFRRPDDGSGSCPRIGVYQAHLIVNVHDPDALDLGIEQGIVLGCLRGLRRSLQAEIVKNHANVTLSLADQFSQDTLRALENVIQYLGRMPGRRTLLLTSAGFLTRSEPLLRRLQKIVDAALRARVVINALDAKGVVAEIAGGNSADEQPIPLRERPDLTAFADRLQSERNDAMNDPMALLPQGTGGRFLHNSNDLANGLRVLASAPDVSYLLGFSPDSMKPDGRYHNLKVTLTGPDHLKVDARRGYFAPDKSKPAQLTQPEKFDAAVLATDDLAGIPVEIATHSEKLDSGEQVLKTVIHVDVRNLPFQRRADRSVQRLRCVTALFDKQGKFLAAVEAVVDLALKEPTRTSLSAHGLDQQLTLQAPPGSYKLRVVVQELIQGSMAALSRPVEIR